MCRYRFTRVGDVSFLFKENRLVFRTHNHKTVLKMYAALHARQRLRCFTGRKHTLKPQRRYE